ACADMFQDGFSVGVSRDAGKSFQKVMKLPELQGPLTCAPVQTACAAHWARIEVVLTADAGTPPPDAGAGTSGSGKGSCSSIDAGALAALAALTLAVRRRRRESSPADPAGDVELTCSRSFPAAPAPSARAADGLRESEPQSRAVSSDP